VSLSQAAGVTEPSEGARERGNEGEREGERGRGSEGERERERQGEREGGREREREVEQRSMRWHGFDLSRLGGVRFFWQKSQQID
jgi:hypothetical protein